jgi:hypothetical protein
MASGVLHAACKSMIKKGMTPEVVRLMAPYVKHGHHLVVTNISFCLSELLQVEQQLIQQQQQQQQQQVSGSKAQQQQASGGKKQRQKQQKQQEDHKQQQDQLQEQQQLPPVLSTVLELVEVQKFANCLAQTSRTTLDSSTRYGYVVAGRFTRRLTQTFHGAWVAFAIRELLADCLFQLQAKLPIHSLFRTCTQKYIISRVVSVPLIVLSYLHRLISTG